MVQPRSQAGRMCVPISIVVGSIGVTPPALAA